MLRGIELEPEAVEVYEFIVGEAVQEVGVCWLDESKRVGASPDRLVGSKGTLRN